MEKQSLGRAGAVTLPMAALFGWLAYAVTQGWTERFDLAVRARVHAWASPPLTFAMQAITMLGSIQFLAILGAVVVWLLLQTGRRRAAFLLVAAALGGECLDNLLKLFFARPRPAVFFGLPQPPSYSFPSGHSMASCCFYGALAMIAAARLGSRARRWAVGMSAAAVILLVGFSRVYLGVHYPTDVLGGYAAGFAWLWLLAALAGRLRPEP